MKRAEIKPGVYAYKPGQWDYPRPVLIVANDYWRSRFRRQDGETSAFYPDTVFRRFTGGDQYPDSGLPGFDFGPAHQYGDGLGRRGDQAKMADHARRLLHQHRQRRLTADTFAGLRTAKFKAPAGLRGHLYSPAFILGEWADWFAEYQATIEDRATLAERLAAESAARVAEATKRVEALRALGLPGTLADPRESEHQSYRSGYSPPSWSGNTGEVRLSMAQVDALLSLIPDGARFVEPNVADDGWTYAEPEGQE